eukprot:TRINITY_DN8407_c0_g1_i1.p1 TRINITY_DN8407_c0_g1~~TRINITY_DN8407_c0_g1_i1.p1  ORF type:complete len:706 (-),score=122.33 TRINITY_DN8407_c0_g1_i1:80-2197(-)
MGDFIVHRGQFVEWQPETIEAIAGSQTRKLIAVSRSNGNVELWVCRSSLSQIETIYGSKKEPMRSLAWATTGGRSRLFGASLSGVIREWDPNTLATKNLVPANGTGIWSIAVSPDNTHLVAAYSDGNLRVFDISNDRIELVRSIPVTKEKLLSVAWHPDGKSVVVGTSVGQVAVVSPYSGEICVVFMINSATNGPKNVWTVLFLGIDVIVTGSSGGLTEFWDANFGTSLYSFSEHSSDVLTLATTPNQSVVFAAGLDTRLVMFQSSNGPSGIEWTVFTGRKPHTHDIRSLAIVGNNIYSGGVDTIISCISLGDFMGSKALQYYPFPKESIASLCPEKKLLLIRHNTQLDLWVLGSSLAEAQKQSYASDPTVTVATGPKLILKLTPKIDFNIRTSAISSSGKYVALTSSDGLRLYTLEISNGTVTNVTPTLLPATLSAARKLEFTSDEHFLIVGGYGPESDQVALVDLTQSAVVVSVNHTQEFYSKTRGEEARGRHLPIVNMKSSAYGKYLAVSDSGSHVSLYLIEDGKLEFQHSVSSGTRIIDLAFDPQERTFMYLTDANNVRVFGIPPSNVHPAGCTMYPYFEENRPKFQYTATSLQFHHGYAGQENIFLSHYGYIMRLPLAEPPQDSTGVEKLSSATFASDRAPTSVVLTVRSDPMLFFGFVDAKTIVILEQPWERVRANLPNPVASHQWELPRNAMHPTKTH